MCSLSCCLCDVLYFFFFKQKTAYEMRISDWSSDVCSSDLLKRLRSVPGLADARIQQSMRYPQIDVDVDRARMAQYGLDQRDVTQSLGIGLAGTSQSAPVFFLNPENGVSYPVVAQIGRAHV